MYRLLALVFLLAGCTALVASYLTNGFHVGEAVPHASPPAAPVAWHDPGASSRPSQRVLFLPPVVLPLVAVQPLEEVTELDPDVADALAQSARFAADFDTAKFDVVTAHVQDPAKAQAILESDLRSRDVAHAFAAAPDWLRHVAIDHAVAEGAARQDEILRDPAAADQMIQALADRLQAP